MVDEAKITKQYIEVMVLDEIKKARITKQYVEVLAKFHWAVKTVDASDIKAYSVQLNGLSETFNQPDPTGPNNSLSVYFEYSKNSNFTDSELSVPFTITEIGNFYDSIIVDFTNLYYFRAIATDGTTTWYGHSNSFVATDYYHEDDLISGDFEDLEFSGGSLRLVSGELIGTRITDPYDISSLENVSQSLVNWTSSEPEGTSILIESRISEDSGINWGGWSPIENESNDFSLLEIEDFSNAVIQYRITLESDTVGVTPTLSFFEVFIADAYLSPPIFNPKGGNHYSNQYITLFCPTEDAEIYYTLDSSNPIDFGILYNDESFLIEEGLVIRAVSYLYEEESFDDPHIYSPIITHTYNIIPFPDSEYKLIHAYRFRNDDGNETTATWKEEENINLEELADTALRMRVGFSGQEDVGPQKLQLDYRIKPVDGNFTDWRIVQGSSGFIGGVRITEIDDIRITETGDIRSF